MKINKTKGFSLVELMIVITIIGAMAAISSYAWQRYVNNAYLRTAAREIVNDFKTVKQRAGSNENTTIIYSIVFDRTAKTYTLTENGVDVLTKQVAQEKPGVEISLLSGGGGSTKTVEFLARGTLNPVTGWIELKNSRNSTARITYNITGKTYVTFTMQ